VRLIIDDVIPDPVIVPWGSSTQVQLKAHFEFIEPPGDTRWRRRLLLRLIRVPPAPPQPPVPWATVDFVPFFLSGISVVNNGDGTYTVSHSGT
jgi:hypothetical protein